MGRRGAPTPRTLGGAPALPHGAAAQPHGTRRGNILGGNRRPGCLQAAGAHARGARAMRGTGARHRGETGSVVSRALTPTFSRSRSRSLSRSSFLALCPRSGLSARLAPSPSPYSLASSVFVCEVFRLFKHITARHPSRVPLF
jgi:hypothetical protein